MMDTQAAEDPRRCSSADAERLFSITHPVHRAFCIVGIAVCGSSTFLAPAFWYIGVLVSAFFVAILGARMVAIGHADQQHAITIFGRGWLAATFAGCTFFVAGNMAFHFCTNVPNVAVGTLGALTGTVPIYLQLSGVHAVHQMVNNAMIAWAFWASPHWSSMPHVSSTLIMWSSLMLGDLLGIHLRQELLRIVSQGESRAAEPGAAEPGAIDDPNVAGGKQESPLPSPPIAMARFQMAALSLTFDDLACEAQYVCRTSERSRVASSSVAVGMTLVALVSVASVRDTWTGVLLLYCLGLAALVLARNDAAQQVQIAQKDDKALAEAAADGIDVSAATSASAVAPVEVASLHATLPSPADRTLAPPPDLVLLQAHARFCSRCLFLRCLCGACALMLHHLGKGTCKVEGSSIGGLLLSACVLVDAFRQWLVCTPPEMRAISRVALLIGASLFHLDEVHGEVSSGDALKSLALCACVLALGDLGGYTLDYARRGAFVHSQLSLHERMRAALRMREAAAERNRLMEAQRLERAQRNADSRLNHVIKGRCGTARSTIAAFLQLHRREVGHELPRALRVMLEQTIDSLGEAIQWCHRRQMFVQLEEGTYTSRCTLCNLEDLLRASLAIDGDLGGEIDCSEAALSLWLDESVLRLVLDEALSNARKYREPQTPILITARLDQRAGRAGYDRAGYGAVEATSTVGARDGARDDDAASRPTFLDLAIINTNSVGVHVLGEEELVRVMQPGYKARRVSAMSDGVGLDSTAKACTAAGGFAWLEMNNTQTTLHLKLPASTSDGSFTSTSDRSYTSASHDRAISSLASHELPTTSVQEQPRPTLEQPHPPVAACAMAGLRQKARSCEIFDSPQSSTSTSTSPLEGMGPLRATDAVLSRGPLRASDAVLSSLREDPIHPICLGLDEDSPSRSLLKVLFVDYLHADLTHSAALGATLDEQEAFVDVALGHVALNSALTCSALNGSIASAALARSTPKAADVVLIDQNVYDTGKVGTQIASELRHFGFTGLICMVTSGSPEVIRASLGGASIDLVLEKASSLDTMAVSIRHALQARRVSSAVAAGWVDRKTPSKGPSRALPSATASGSPTSRKPLAMQTVRASSAPVAGAAAKAPSPCPLQVPSEPVPLEPNLEPAAVGGEMLTLMVPLGTEPVTRGASGAAHAPLVADATGLVCFGIDDEPLPRMVQELLFIHHLHADMSRSRSLGETVSEQLAFVDIALGLVDPWTLESCGARAPADVVLLDENINPELTPEPVTGSYLARRLHERGFMGVVCILTGASQEVMDALLKLPGIDLVFAKGAAIQEMAKDIMACLQKKRPLLDDARR